MKKIFFTVLLLITISQVNAQVKFDALQVTPAQPKALQTVNFKFNSKLSSLIEEHKIEILVYLFDKSDYKVLEPKITQVGTVYSGSFKLDSNTACIAFGFANNEKKLKDNNAGDGYLVPVYGNNNQPVMDYYVGAGKIYNGQGEQLFGMKTVSEKNLSLLEEGISIYPEAKNDMDYFSAYLGAINSVRKKEGEPLIQELLTSLANKPDIKESDYNILTRWYNRIKMKSTSDSFNVIMKEKFPDGQWKKYEKANAMSKDKDAESKKATFEAFIKAYPPTKADKSNVDFYKTVVAAAYLREKNYDAFKIWMPELPIAEKMSTYNALSWEMALAKENLTYAKQLSYEATTWAKKEMNNPAEKKPASITKKQWADQRKNGYGMYADTYSLILYELGDYKNGYQYAKEAATINKFKDIDYNERYSQLMVKVTPPAMAKKELEKFVEEGVASSKTKELLKEMYVVEKKSDNGYDAYLTKLEIAAKEKKRAALAKDMLNEAAPKFSLKDFDGKDVSLASLTGKVVIADFWATWCGPCIASMPAMKKAQEKLTANGDVAFVFIDTWESAENKKQNAQDFMTKNNYPFQVLMDDEDRVVTDFKVNGIPTKFVIDKTGHIRFKTVGWNGSDEALVDELSMMVEMAALDMPARKYVK